MMTPAPSPMMKPSRSLSNGRLARCGSSLRVDSARIAAETADAHRRDGRLGPAGDHHVGVVALDDLEGVADGVRRGRARRARRRVRSLGAETDGDLAGRQIDDRGRNEERRDAARARLR